MLSRREGHPQSMHAQQRTHLKRLSNVWIKNPIYFITVCVAQRRPVLISTGAPALIIRSWQQSAKINAWAVGRYVIMPDHVHFFARARPDGKTIAAFMRDWKRWTGNQISGKIDGLKPPIWQPEFFDHVLRSADSYIEKWNYVRENPVRAGLVSSADVWPFAGECEVLTF